MSDVKKVVVVRKKVSPIVTSWESDKVMGKRARKTRARAVRAEGRDFFTFCWNSEKFKVFAEKCIKAGERPNEVVWAMIEDSMRSKE